jgi:SAM-dependent methyltransferase
MNSMMAMSVVPRLSVRPLALVRPPEKSPVWDELAPAVYELKKLLHDADREAAKRGAIPDVTVARVMCAFGELESLVEITIGESAPWSAEEKACVGGLLRTELYPYLLMSQSAERWCSKPRGYAGDYLTIAQLYENIPQGTGRIGPLLDRCFLNVAAAHAVRNRRGLLAREIQSAIDGASRTSSPARVTSLACGPAQELFDVYDTLVDPSVLRSTLIDMDWQALAHVAERRDQRHLKTQMSLVNENLVYAATGRRALDLRDQDLVYSIGLTDYFSDDFVVKLMTFVHQTLRPGGRIVLGNFHPRNTTRALLDHVFDWRLIHRTEEDMDRLFRASAFRRGCTRVVFEEQGINLFAECVKQ